MKFSYTKNPESESKLKEFFFGGGGGGGGAGGG